MFNIFYKKFNLIIFTKIILFFLFLCNLYNLYNIIFSLKIFLLINFILLIHYISIVYFLKHENKKYFPILPLITIFFFTTYTLSFFITHKDFFFSSFDEIVLKKTIFILILGLSFLFLGYIFADKLFIRRKKKLFYFNLIKNKQQLVNEIFLPNIKNILYYVNYNFIYYIIQSELFDFFKKIFHLLSEYIIKFKGRFNSLLTLACAKTSFELVDLLLKNGAKDIINYNPPYTNSALYISCIYNDNISIINLLICNGANKSINIVDDKGKTILMNLIIRSYKKNNRINIIKLLIENGGTETINNLDNNKESALLYVCKHRPIEYYEIVKLLLENGASETINTINNEECTPLYYAFYKYNDIPLVQLLLCYGAKNTVKIKESFINYYNEKKPFFYYNEYKKSLEKQMELYNLINGRNKYWAKKANKYKLKYLKLKMSIGK